MDAFDLAVAYSGPSSDERGRPSRTASVSGLRCYWIAMRVEVPDRIGMNAV